MSAVSPFLWIKTTDAFFQLLGTLPSLKHLLNNWVSALMMGSPPSCRTAVVMLSSPGALPRFNRLIATLTSDGKIG